MIMFEVNRELCPICSSPRIRMYKDQAEGMRIKYKCNDCGARWVNEDDDDL